MGLLKKTGKFPWSSSVLIKTVLFDFLHLQADLLVLMMMVNLDIIVGSGAMTVLEAFRVLIESNTKLINPVEFHWYAGEEAGLLGSQAVAKSYNEKGEKVI